MIVVENLEINGVPFTYTTSDSNRYVVRDEHSYVEAYDPASFGRTYTEGDVISEGDSNAEELLSILLGGDAE